MAQAKTLTTTELEQVLRYISTTKYAERNRAMLLMGFWAGLRVKEIAQLKMGDVLNEDGTIKSEIRLRKQIEMPKRIREWWFKNELGKVCFCVKYGSRPLELAKGKHSVEVGNPAELVKALELVKGAVEAGELDAQIEFASGAVRAGFRK